jgi:hypothetical protein
MTRTTPGPSASTSPARSTTGPVPKQSGGDAAGVVVRFLRCLAERVSQLRTGHDTDATAGSGMLWL